LIAQQEKKLFGVGPIHSSQSKGPDSHFLPEDPLGGIGKNRLGAGGEDGGEWKHQHLQTQRCVSTNLLYYK